MRITSKAIYERVDRYAARFDLGVEYAYGNGARLTNTNGSAEYSERMPSGEMNTLLDGFDIGVERNLMVIVLCTYEPVMAIRAKDIVVSGQGIKFEALRAKRTWYTDSYCMDRKGGRYQLDGEGDWILEVRIKRLSDLTEEEVACLTYLPQKED